MAESLPYNVAMTKRTVLGGLLLWYIPGTGVTPLLRATFFEALSYFDSQSPIFSVMEGGISSPRLASTLLTHIIAGEKEARRKREERDGLHTELLP